jgi:hypothetical protein
MRRRKKVSEQEFAAQQVVGYASRLLTNRWALLCPFPVDRRDIYHHLFTDEQHAAMEVLNTFAPSSLARRNELVLTIDETFRVAVRDRALNPKTIKIQFQQAVPLPVTETRFGTPKVITVSSLPIHLRVPLLDWAFAWTKASAETRLTIERIRELFGICKTFGHVNRVWPNAAKLLPDEAQAKLAQAKVRSPYPEGAFALARDEAGRVTGRLPTIDSAWHPDNLAWFDDRLTEALCLPVPEGNTDFDATVDSA